MWVVKATVSSVVIWALSGVTPEMGGWIQQIPGTIFIQKNAVLAVLGTAKILCRTLRHLKEEFLCVFVRVCVYISSFISLEGQRRTEYLPTLGLNLFSGHKWILCTCLFYRRRLILCSKKICFSVLISSSSIRSLSLCWLPFFAVCICMQINNPQTYVMRPVGWSSEKTLCPLLF